MTTTLTSLEFEIRDLKGMAWTNNDKYKDRAYIGRKRWRRWWLRSRYRRWSRTKRTHCSPSPSLWAAGRTSWLLATACWSSSAGRTGPGSRWTGWTLYAVTLSWNNHRISCTFNGFTEAVYMYYTCLKSK